MFFSISNGYFPDLDEGGTLSIFCFNKLDGLVNPFKIDSTSNFSKGEAL
jgi:hypothetical protein